MMEIPLRSRDFPRLRPRHAALFLLAVGCAGLPAMGPIALKIGKSLLDAATANYSPEYGDAINDLWGALTTVKKPQSPSAAAAARPPGEALSLEVALLKEVVEGGATSLVEIQDGDVLHDGGSELMAGDKFKLSFRANQSCYVYALAIDGTGWVTPIFPGPESSMQNPVSPDRVCLVPEGTRWYALDEYRGVEHVYLLASYERRPDLEQMLARFAGMERPQRAEYRAVKEASVAKRGIVAVGEGTPTRVETESGAAHEVTPTAFLADIQGIDLVITRWFRHE